MNYLIFAIFGMILSVPLFCKAEGGDFDLAQIKTVYGKVYRDVYIVEADRYGLTFRHRDGIAKVVFSSLSANLRMLYEGTDEVGKDEGDAEKKELAAADASGSMKSESTGITGPGNDSAAPLVFTVRNRVTLPSPAFWLGGGPLCAGRMGWPGNWHRNSSAHRLTNPYCRELVVRDFLYSSGLIPKPPGIFTYPVPYRSRLLFY